MPDVFAAQYQLTPKRQGRLAGDKMLDVLAGWLSRKRLAVPTFGWEDPASARFDDGTMFRWAPYRQSGCELFDFTLAHPDSADSALTWTTRVEFMSTPTRTTLGMRVSHTYALRSGPNRLTTRPRLILDAHEHFEVATAYGRLQVRPVTIERGDVQDFVAHVLCDPHRTLPTVLFNMDIENHTVTPKIIGVELFGLADVYVLGSRAAAAALKAVLGRYDLAVPRGALRVYHPGFVLTANAMEHPLLLPVRLQDRKHREFFAKRLAFNSVRHYRSDPVFDELREERALAYDESRRRIRETVTQALVAARDKQDYEALALQYAEENGLLKDDIRELRERLADTQEKLAAARYALASVRLEHVDDETGDEPLYAPDPQSVLDVVHWAQRAFGDRLYFLPSALETAEASPYKQPMEARRLIQALAHVALQIQTGVVKGGILQAFKRENVDYAVGVSKSTSRKLAQQYRFSDGSHGYVCEEHLRKGNDPDPAKSLRIYFTTDDLNDGRVVIGHVGNHLDTARTN